MLLHFAYEIYYRIPGEVCMSEFKLIQSNILVTVF
jgi:hypothetical protein